jgi:branched-chain amino acid transport system substrate-binding protein
MDSTTTKLRASGLALSVALLITNFSSCGYAQETIKIGVIAPNSGPYTIIGEEVRNGFSLYLAEIGNTAGGRKLEMLHEDTEAKPDVGLTKVKKLVERDGVAFVGGVVSSSVAYALHDYVVAQKMPLVITVASAVCS